MRSFRSFEALPADAFTHPTAVTIGKFDGIHKGHRAIIERLLAVSKEHSLEPAVFTFTENPLKVLNPAACPPALNSPEQRFELLAGLGISAALMVDFTRELSEFSPEEFAQKVLREGMNARQVLMGADFRFGRGGSGDVELLTQLGRELGFAVHITEDVVFDGKRVSSSRIRALLAAGDIAAAAQLLERPVRIRGLVVHGAERGRLLGFPTANLQPKYEGLAPADGVYAGLAHVAGKTHMAAISIGGNPTFTPDAPSQVEVHLLDFRGSIYGELMTVEFKHRLRGMTKFTGIDDLVKQMEADIQQTRDLLI
ncbi:bifunctional riboflavin kinase/FAD synthetase [Canibacter zhoujuaniae]|uniref:bifunctional riboflavin kinase/FAD synthetase n=1 Tax=Canibacter zhoujuaniae TaxID=2708343 RepID=UPI0014208FCC|nr:bifunctional riboflavin kinase/FAD synthetase [Canibacter zhoujuaniae]